MPDPMLIRAIVIALLLCGPLLGCRGGDPVQTTVGGSPPGSGTAPVAVDAKMTTANAQLQAGVVASVLSKTLLVAEIANDAAVSLGARLLNGPDRSGVVPGFLSSLPAQAAPATDHLTGTCDAPGAGMPSADAGQFFAAGSVLNQGYGLAEGLTLQVDFTQCLIQGIDLDGGFDITRLSFDDDPGTTDRVEILSGLILFKGFTVRTIGKETSLNSWDAGGGQIGTTFSTAILPSQVVVTEMATGDMVATQDQVIDNNLAAMDLRLVYDPATNVVQVEANGRLEIDSELLGIAAAVTGIETTQPLHFILGDQGPYMGEMRLTDDSDTTVLPESRPKLDLTALPDLSIEGTPDLDGDGIADSVGWQLPWEDLAALY